MLFRRGPMDGFFEKDSTDGFLLGIFNHIRFFFSFVFLSFPLRVLRAEKG
jgi:hypothetical protein